MITSFFKPKVTAKDKRTSSSSDDGDSNVHNKRPRLGEASRDNDETKTNGASFMEDAVVCPHVRELRQHLEEASNKKTDDLSVTWYSVLRQYTCTSRDFQCLATFVAAQRKLAPSIPGRGAIYPPPSQVFSSLYLTPIHTVKVVIVGKYPYHQYNQGHGLAFSVKRGVKIPPSLRNMYKELLADTNVSDFTTMPNHGCLERWATQGVLMLNSVLTVRDSEANSHANKGWEQFTSAIIRALDEFCDSNQKGLVFLLWGKPASKKAAATTIRTNKRHTIICTSHPSPLGATKTKTPFLGSRCFSKANEALIQMGVDPIQWNVDS